MIIVTPLPFTHTALLKIQLSVTAVVGESKLLCLILNESKMAKDPKFMNKDYGRMFVFHLTPKGLFANINKLTIKAVTKRSLKPTNQVSYNIIITY